MSKSEIAHWVTTASAKAVSFDDDDSEEEPSAEAPLVELNDEDNWKAFLVLAKKNLFSSKPKVRMEFLHEKLDAVASRGDLTLSQVMDVLGVLSLTYPRYDDAASRDAVVRVLETMVKRDELRGLPEGEPDAQKMGVAEQVFGWITIEVGRVVATKSSTALGSQLTLLVWCCALYDVELEHNPNFSASPQWKGLLGLMAALLDGVLEERPKVKGSVQKSAVVHTRRAIRTHSTRVPLVLSTLLESSKSSPTPMVFAALLGLVCDVAIHLKPLKDDPSPGLAYLEEAKSGILDFYTSSILLSKTVVPKHSAVALSGFIGTAVTEKDVEGIILPSAEKALMRSPEISLAPLALFIDSTKGPISKNAFSKLLTATLSCAKSSNPVTRTNSVKLFRSALSKTTEDEVRISAATEVLALPKAGKTTGPDHRVALYGMFNCVRSSPSLSPSVLPILPPLLAKETNEEAVTALQSALAEHLVQVIRDGQPIPPDVLSTISKEMIGSKVPLRRAFCSVVGTVFWDLRQDAKEASTTTTLATLAKAIVPSVESILKAMGANPLAPASSGHYEGYIAVFVAVQWKRLPPLKEIVAKNPVLQSLSATGTKPSFVFWDKVYLKLTEQGEELWLVRCTEATIPHLQEDLKKTESLRVLVGNLLLHLSTNLSSAESRKESLSSLRSLCQSNPSLTHQLIREAAQRYLPSAPSDDQTRARRDRFNSLLAAISSFDDSVQNDVREELIVELIIIAHHHEASTNPRQCWIESTLKAGLDPHKLIAKAFDRLLAIILDVPLGSNTMTEASRTAVTTLAFVAPDVTVNPLVSNIAKDLAVDQLEGIGPTEYSIFQTPEGTLFVDVLAMKKDSPAAAARKGKDQAIEKWEAELRKSLASKKATGTPSLSKQDQALVSAQLAKEAEIRQKVKLAKAHFERGLDFIRALTVAGADELKEHIASLANLLLDGVLPKAAVLVGSRAFDTYLDLGKCCSPRLETLNIWIGVATLRSFEIPVVPDNMRDEVLCDLVLRIAYRLRTLSEQSPFDAATFSYILPLLLLIIRNGGVDTSESEVILEQVALSLDVLGFHCEKSGDIAFPRLDTARGLINAIAKYPKLSREASSSLIGLGQAIYPSATSAEVSLIVQATLSQEVYVRNACLQTLQPFDITDLNWSPELWLACHDEDEQNARLASQLWEENGLDVSEGYLQDLIPLLGHENRYVRASCPHALASAVEAVPNTFGDVSRGLRQAYKDKAKIVAPEFDQFGMLIEHSLNRQDPWQARITIGRSFEKLAPLFTAEEVVPFIDFLVAGEALGDDSEEVRRAMLDAGTAVIDHRGQSHLPDLIAMFEGFLAKKTPPTDTSDRIQEAVVILFGRVARHLERADPRVKKVIDRLVEALKTPSEVVQSAVSDCLSPLVQLTPSDTPQLVDRLLNEMFTGAKYAERRGAAYGLAGVIKGSGLKGLKQYKIIQRLRAAIDDKKRFESRQGALFALETLSATLGRLFEPYVIELLPLLLATFGDQTSDVRDATQDAAKILMYHMSGYGVKLILPTLLEGLEEKQWRSKKGSIELLGTMAFCAPKQLSTSLPTVIPRLTEVLTDSHVQVRSAANKSLKQFGEVISNPEIQALTPILLKALVDPEKTPAGLNALLKTSFVHFIDSPSLALVVPIIERGLKERSAETKRKAAQIVGNLASLTESKDFVPYLDRLLPLVHVVLVDPVPEARATAAKALGTLVERLGESTFPELVASLLQTLKSDTSGVDRQGAAQGLSEVLSGLGMERMEGLLPDVIQNAQSPRSYVREGFMSLLVYLPATFGHRFTPYLGRIIQPVLDGLADVEELVRSASMKAGRMIISQYSNKAIDLLLPELEKGMFDDSWRIRHSSVTLIGELLYKISGISKKADLNDDDDEEADVATAETSRKALTDTLGKERRDSVLASLYLVRQDSVAAVRQACLHIWKALVHNTPRTVRDILPHLVNQILELLAAYGADQQETAARTLGELCRKLGEKILGEIVPILRSGSASPNSQTREGVCLAIAEITESTSDAQREDHEFELVSIVRGCLVDESAKVRAAAAAAFDILQEHVGENAVSQTIPTLLDALGQPGEGAGTALQALKEILTVRASTVFPEIVPTLISSPITTAHAQALTQLVTVAGSSLSKRINQILQALVRCSETEKDEDVRDAALEAIRSVLQSVSDLEGLNALMLLLLGWAKTEGPLRRASAVNFFGIFCEVTDLDFSLYRVDWIRQLVTLMDDSQPPVVQASWEALDAFIKVIPKDELEGLVVPLRRTIDSTGAPGRSVPGFSLPKGISPMLPVIFAGLTGGTSEQREQAALAISDLVERTSESAIKPYVTQLTGPLIRVITQATTLPPAVKSAILTALTTMLDTIPTFVKPFFPQLQRTFCKSAADPASLAVRTKAAVALGSLFKSQTRIDPLISELISGVETNEDAIAASLALALANAVRSAGSNVGQASRESLVELIEASFSGQHDDSFYNSVAQIFSALAFDSATVKGLIEGHLIAGKRPHALTSHMLAESVANSPQVYYDLNCVIPIVRQVVACISSEVPSISRPAREARETLKTQPPWLDDDSVQAVF